MKQKVVIEVATHGQECRMKALKVVAGFSGVLSVALKGDDLRQIELTGVGVDVTGLTKCLRKKVGHAELVSVVLLGDKKNPGTSEPSVAPPPCWLDHQYHRQYYIVYQDRCPDPSCSIM